MIAFSTLVSGEPVYTINPFAHPVRVTGKLQNEFYEFCMEKQIPYRLLRVSNGAFFVHSNRLIADGKPHSFPAPRSVAITALLTANWRSRKIQPGTLICSIPDPEDANIPRAILRFIAPLHAEAIKFNHPIEGVKFPNGGSYCISEISSKGTGVLEFRKGNFPFLKWELI
jgi:hypothetical protein